jgi:hypothetical protein
MMTKGLRRSGRIKRGSGSEREKAWGADQQSISETDDNGSERGSIEGTRKSGKDRRRVKRRRMLARYCGS